MLTRILARVRAWTRRREIQGTVDEELQFHVEMEAAERRERGVPANEATRCALADLGGTTQVREAVLDVRTPWLGRQFGLLRQDGATSWRVFRRAPGFFAGVLLTLALGIGANGAVFSIVQAVLLQPLPYHEPGRLVAAWYHAEHLAPGVNRRMAPWGELALALHALPAGTLADTATYQSWQGNLEAQFDLPLGDHTERLRGMLATPNFFQVLGVSAARGRVFDASDDKNQEPVLVISDALWRRAFGGDPSIVGRAVPITGGRPRVPKVMTVIGVLQPTFRFTYPEDTEAWAIMPWSSVGRPSTGYWTIARLAPGVSLASANAAVRSLATTTSIGRRSSADDPRITELETVTDWVVAETRPSLLLLAGVSLLLLVIACATVASALFVRVAERQRELAVRAALGADRRRLRRQLLTEGVVLSVAGTALGTGLAWMLAPVLRAVVPPTVPRAGEIGVSAWILAFFAAAASLTTMLAALAPAWRGSRVDLIAALKRTSSSASADRWTARWRQTLVGSQAAIATALLLTSTLLLVSFWRLSHVPLGFNGERVLTVEMRLLTPKYQGHYPPRPAGQPPDPGTLIPSPALVAFQDDLVAGVRGLPGVIDAGLTSAVPFRGVDFTNVLNRVGVRRDVVGKGRYVDPGYFSTLAVPVLKGRVFNATDTATSSPVIVISASFARRMFGDENPIGQSIDFYKPVEVIGVVDDLRYQSADRDADPAIYLPRSQNPTSLICLVARLAPNAGELGPAVRRVIHQIDPDVPAMNLTTVDQIVSDSVASPRFFTTATTAFAALALILTIVGLAIVISRTIVERRRELAIRTALGAPGSRIVTLVARGGLWPVFTGSVVGLAAVYAGAKVLEQFLFHVAPRRPLAYAMVIMLIGAVSIATAVWQARHAARTSPSEVLRAE